MRKESRGVAKEAKLPKHHAYLAQVMVVLSGGEGEFALHCRRKADEHLVKYVIVALVFLLHDDPRLLQQVLLDGAAADAACGRVVQLRVLAKP